MTAVQNLLIEDATNQGVSGVVFVLPACNLLAGEDESDGDEGDDDVTQEHEGGDKSRNGVFVTKKVDLVAHFEQDADTILNECRHKKDAAQKREVRRGGFACTTD